MPWSRATCPACKAELIYHPGKRTSSTGGEVPCPYLSLPLAELRAGHDQIYFGPWRKMEATQLDIQRAYNQLGRHLTAIGTTLAKRELPSARCDLAKAREADLSADPRGGAPGPSPASGQRPLLCPPGQRRSPPREWDPSPPPHGFRIVVRHTGGAVPGRSLRCSLSGGDGTLQGNAID